MKTLKELCKPRESVFDVSRRDVVLDLSDLIDDRIDPEEFFRENYLTEGMRRLFKEAFRRFEGNTASGVIKLTQAMGGGKTHNMIALGLLAKHPEIRTRIIRDLYYNPKLGSIRVVAFNGRESDAPLGIWGSIAEQLGKKDLFKDYYSPLSAPGQTAWVNLLKGEPLLILLDELPPYLDYARAKQIGNSDLSVVTTTALSNLMVAVGKDELTNVCIVISDLKATYEAGAQQINKALQNLENEVGRVAMNLEPVGMNTDEVYHILRTRLFEQLPEEADIIEIARAYTQSLRDARQMDITSIAPEKYTQLIRESYPFHPAIRDLYARFRENPGFQQTRGLIRLMRTIVARLYNDECPASRLYLIHAHDIDLNDRETLAQINSINPTLDNAISHDIESNGQAAAEILDANVGGSDARDASKLLLVSSLANIPSAVLGLSISEIVGNLCAPNRDITKLKDTLNVFSTQAWYLHSSRDGRLFFKNVQNLVAKLKTMADSYNQESSLRELRDFLSGTFAPTLLKDCYQDVKVLPALDEVNISQDKVTLIIYEPCLIGLHPDLQKFYNDLEFKNRVLFLSGQRDTLNALQDVAKEHRAIKYILEEMKKERIPETDPQYQMAAELQDKINLRLLSAARETFYTLIYPHGGQLLIADFYMNFTDNAYRGEQQIRETLKAKQKFTDDIDSDIFRKKCEQRLFTQKAMPWGEIKKRAAINTDWQWHRVDALDNLKNQLVHHETWREDSSGYVEKGPFPPPKTDVRIQELNRNDETGEVTMKLTPLYGDSIHYEIGEAATGGSLQVDDARAFKTCEVELSFLCLDSNGQHETGEPRWWRNRITLKHRIYQSGSDKMVELRAAPQAQIRYTTDGSSPKTSGGAYDSPFIVPRNAPCVLAIAERGKACSDVHRIDIDWDVKSGFKLDTSRPVFWNRMQSANATNEAYELIDMLDKFNGLLPGPRITVSGQCWVDLSFDIKRLVGASELRRAIEYLRSLVPDGQVVVEAERVKFTTGQQLLDWIAAAKTELNPDEVQQL
jgi:hypothetical protein